jgi:hypothetical protein
MSAMLDEAEDQSRIDAEVLQGQLADIETLIETKVRPYLQQAKLKAKSLKKKRRKTGIFVGLALSNSCRCRFVVF